MKETISRHLRGLKALGLSCPNPDSSCMIVLGLWQDQSVCINCRFRVGHDGDVYCTEYPQEGYRRRYACELIKVYDSVQYTTTVYNDVLIRSEYRKDQEPNFEL